MGIQEHYADCLRLTVGVYGVNLTFGLSDAHPGQSGIVVSPEEQVRVRISLELAKMLTLMLRQQLKNHERASGVIAIPSNIFPTVGVAEEDW